MVLTQSFMLQKIDRNTSLITKLLSRFPNGCSYRAEGGRNEKRGIPMFPLYRNYAQAKSMIDGPWSYEPSYRSEGQSFVYKRESESGFDQSQRLATEFAGTRYLRMPTDWNVENRTLVYPWLRDTLLSLLQKNKNFPKPAIKEILRCTSEAVKELHDKDWIHIHISNLVI